jgi:hypothetical protein
LKNLSPLGFSQAFLVKVQTKYLCFIPVVGTFKKDA